MVNGQKKGKAGELDVIKQLRLWWGGEWSRRGYGKAGSDVLEPYEFPLVTEIKNQFGVAMRHFFFPSKELLAWWQQAKDQCRDDKQALLIAKVERNWFWIANLRQYLAAGFDLPPTYLTTQWAPDEIVMIASLNQVLSVNTKEQVCTNQARALSHASHVVAIKAPNANTPGDALIVAPPDSKCISPPS